MIRARVLVGSGLLVAALMIWPSEAEAQRRRAVRVVPARSVVAVGAYYRPAFYDPWYGWGAPYYGWYPPYAYQHPYYYDTSSAMRLQVEPKGTEVFIDGYYAGTVDDFDGFFQRLRLEPGEHEIELYLPNHRSLKQKIYLQPHATFRIRHEMEPIGAGATPDPRPVPRSDPASATPTAGYGRPTRRESGRPAPERRGESSLDFGTLAIRVQPAGADVIVDGERWEGPQGSERLMLQLPEGEHRIEVRREGYASYASTVRVRRGETVTLNVSLVRE